MTGRGSGGSGPPLLPPGLDDLPLLDGGTGVDREGCQGSPVERKGVKCLLL